MAKRAGRVNWVGGSNRSRVNWVVSRVGLSLPVFFKQVFFFFQLQKQINDNLFRENE